MKENTTKELVEEYVHHLSQRNLEELLDMFAMDIDWHVPGCTEKAPWLGKRSSKAEISSFFRLLWVNTEPISAHIEKMLIKKDTAIIAGEFETRMLSTYKIVNSIFFIHIVFKGGKIIKYTLLEDSNAVFQSLMN